MAINEFEETVITLNEASSLLPKNRDSKKVSLATLHRWIRKGIRGADGEVVKLESVVSGRLTFTTREALKRFFVRLSAVSFVDATTFDVGKR